MRIALWIILGFLAATPCAIGIVLAFDEPARFSVAEGQAGPIREPKDLPPLRMYNARDRVALGFRAYKGGGAHVVVIIHGASDDGHTMHPIAETLRTVGASVYVPVLRGHDEFGRLGDLDYSGQLKDDLVDFVTFLRSAHLRPAFPS
jgi:alpha-beta hydrolase superfamily lysophospholipase